MAFNRRALAIVAFLVTTAEGFTCRPNSHGIVVSSKLKSSPSSDDEAKMREMTEKLFGGSSIPSNPFETGFSGRPSKADVYGSEELQALLDIHNDSINEMQPNDNSNNRPNPDVDESNVLGLHEMVLQKLGVESTDIDTDVPPLPEQTNNDWLSDDFKNRISNVRAIASDVDGTLLTSDQTLHPRTKQAIQRAVGMAYSPLDDFKVFFPATGKSRKGALDSLGKEIGGLLSQSPGVFLQGLYCVDANGEVIFQKKLNTLAVEAAEELVAESGLSIVAYDGDTLLTTKMTKNVVELSNVYGEPMPRLVADGKAISTHGPSVHKILLLDDDTERLTNEIRPRLEELATECDATVTQALPNMLELLPWGCSKALGVQKVCETLNIDMGSELLALGDAENDKGMMEQASIGVAMGNASPTAQESSDFVMTETNNEGGAGAAMEVFGFGQY